MGTEGSVIRATRKKAASHVRIGKVAPWEWPYSLNWVWGSRVLNIDLVS